MAGMTIEGRGLYLRYGEAKTQQTLALDGVDIDIGSGTTVAFMGRSGSGKSSLLHVLGAMQRPSDGLLMADGVRIERLSAREASRFRRRVGFVFQRFHLLPMLSALDNVMLPALPYRPGKALAGQAMALLASVGLQGRHDSRPAQLSGGEQQRVAIARALVNAPDVVLADEPTGSLDSVTGAQVAELIFELHQEHGFTLVIATHDAQIAGLCSRTVSLVDGKVADLPAEHRAPTALTEVVLTTAECSP